MIAIISAMTKDRVIGVGGTLPWDLPEDLAQFKRRTLGKTVIMGLRTFRSIGRPLPKRNNIVLSDTPVEIPGVSVCTTLEDALATARAFGTDIFFIGGGMVYRLALPLVDTLVISWVKRDYAGDTTFPAFDLDEWEEVEREPYADFETVTYRRKTSPEAHA